MTEFSILGELTF